MCVMQGDKRPITFSILDKDGQTIPLSSIVDIEYLIGAKRFTLSNKDISCDENFKVVLDQEFTFSLPCGRITQQIRVKFAGEDEWVLGNKLEPIEVVSSDSEEVL